MTLKIFSVVVMVFSLTACFDNDDDPTFQLPPGIDVITVSGLIVTLDGTLERSCAINASGADSRVTESISRNSGTRTDYLYTSDDGTCSGTETTVVYEVTFTAGTVMTITGWVNLAGVPVVPPLAQDASGPLLANESVTSLTITINSVTPADPNIPPGTEVPGFYVVDDTVAGAPVMYGKSDNSNNAFNLPMTLQ